MATTPRPVPKTYPAGTGRPTTRRLTEKKVVRTINVAGTVWDAGKKRAAAEEISISHAVNLLIEAYAVGLLDLDSLTAQLDGHADDQGQQQDPATPPGTDSPATAAAWAEEAPLAFSPGWGNEDAPSAFANPYADWGAAVDVPSALDDPEPRT
ncbi:hypothetical protein ACF087_36415 [Streptomyces goshikiensis]|uniref:hypothetical protein n=1 Tax=Streptomyces goshikiensis TaxID=1942 RepID=UPI0036F648D2